MTELSWVVPFLLLAISMCTAILIVSLLWSALVIVKLITQIANDMAQPVDDIDEEPKFYEPNNGILQFGDDE